MKKIYIIGLLLACLCCAARPQERKIYRGEVRVKQDSFVISHDRLRLDMHLSFSGLKVGRTQSLELTPVLFDGKRQVRLQPVVINGANKQKMFRRAIRFHGEKAARGAAYLVVKNEPAYLQEIVYTQSIPYLDWMNDARLLLEGRLCNYAGNPVITFTDELTDRIVIYEDEKTK